MQPGNHFSHAQAQAMHNTTQYNPYHEPEKYHRARVLSQPACQPRAQPMSTGPTHPTPRPTVPNYPAPTITYTAPAVSQQNNHGVNAFQPPAEIQPGRPLRSHQQPRHEEEAYQAKPRSEDDISEDMDLCSSHSSGHSIRVCLPPSPTPAPKQKESSSATKRTVETVPAATPEHRAAKGEENSTVAGLGVATLSSSPSGEESTVIRRPAKLTRNRLPSQWVAKDSAYVTESDIPFANNLSDGLGFAGPLETAVASETTPAGVGQLEAEKPTEKTPAPSTASVRSTMSSSASTQTLAAASDVSSHAQANEPAPPPPHPKKKKKWNQKRKKSNNEPVSTSQGSSRADSRLSVSDPPTASQDPPKT